MATHSRSLFWRVPWAEEPGGLQSMGLQRVRHDSATKTIKIHAFTILAILSVQLGVSSTAFHCCGSVSTIPLQNFLFPSSSSAAAEH